MPNSPSAFKTSFPLHYKRPRGEDLPISTTWYRNAHFRELSMVKNHYKDVWALPQLKNIAPVTERLFILLVLYKPNKRRMDVDNYTAIQSKFFFDSLVAAKIVVDDDTTYIPLTLNAYGGIDKDNPRVDIYCSTDFKYIGKLTRKYLCP